jgi:hypothetical protein
MLERDDDTRKSICLGGVVRGGVGSRAEEHDQQDYNQRLEACSQARRRPRVFYKNVILR